MTVILCFLMGFLSIIVLYLFEYLKNIRFYKLAAKIPGPKAYPIVGNLLSFVGKDSTAVHAVVLDMAERYTSPARMWVGNQLFVGICEPDQLKILLASPKSMGKPNIYKFMVPWFGNALILAPVPMWRVHRKLIQPAFNSQTLRTFVHIFDKNSKLIVEKMEEELDAGEFQVSPYMASYSFSVTLEGILGLSETSNKKMFTHYTQCVNRAFGLVMKRAFVPWLHPDIIFNLTKMSKDFYKSITGMHEIVHFILATKKIQLENSDSAEKDNIVNQRKNFLDILLDLHSKQIFSEEDICDEVNFMIAAAYDTTSVSLQFIMLMLASYPDVQEKIYQELKQIYGEVISKNINVTNEDLKQMKYTERVIQESMRLFPAVPLVLRKVEEDLEIGDYILPKSTTVLCLIARIHRDEKYWPDPLKFEPDRFLPEEVEKRNPYCYLPFSGGPRNCLGFVYAMMKMKIFVARIVLAYILKKKHIQPIINIKQKTDAVAPPVEPITIEIVRRLCNP